MKNEDLDYPLRLYEVVIRREQFYKAEVIAKNTTEAFLHAKEQALLDTEFDENVYHNQWQCTSAFASRKESNG